MSDLPLPLALREQEMEPHDMLRLAADAARRLERERCRKLVQEQADNFRRLTELAKEGKAGSEYLKPEYRMVAAALTEIARQVAEEAD